MESKLGSTSRGPGGQDGRERKETPQLILLDLKLPKLDGLGLLRRIRSDERTRLLPVVILTSSTEEMDRINSYGLGANSYVRERWTSSNFWLRQYSSGFIGWY